MRWACPSVRPSMSVRLSVAKMRTQKCDFLKKIKQNKDIVSIDDLYRKSYMGFSKNPLLGP